jgi:amino acid transporter
VKLLPLLAFIATGLFFVHRANLTLHSTANSGAWLDAVLALIFAFGGFEGAVIPMSEAKDPRRDAPFALFAALGVTTLVYTLVQVVVTGILSHPEQTDRPLAAAAHQVFGAPGGALIAAGALVSVYGLLSSMALYTPRLTFALAERRDFPAFFAAVHPRFRTPYVSILVYTALVWTLAVAGSFRWNLGLSAVARLFTYAPTCAALIVLRRKHPDADSFRLPAGPLLAVLGVGFSAILITRMGRTDFAIVGVTVIIALANWLWAKSGTRYQASRAREG